jgi:hypothetical protein
MSPVSVLLAVSLVSGAAGTRPASLAEAVRNYTASYAASPSASATADAPIPSFTRQTGLACNVCHTAFPQLTAFGRRFKLNGYTLTGLQVVTAGQAPNQSLKLDVIPPVSAMAQASVTQLKTAVPGTQNGDAAFPQELSLFVGEAITPRIGTFIQLTYDGADGSIGIDNADIRYANHAQVGTKDLTYGFTLNNNPTVQDVWNTTPVWGFPYNASGVAPTPGVATLIDGGLEQQVAGLGAYAMYDDLLYAEFSVYRSAPQGGAQPPDATSEGILHGVAPYWRAALTHSWGARAVELGTYGMSAEMYPSGVAGPTNRFTDVALDAQYEQPVGQGSFTAHATWIHERQTLDASFAAGDAANSFNTVDAVKVNGVFYTPNRIGIAGGYFSTTGSADAGLYTPGDVTGFAANSPNSAGIIGELSFMPWLNTRFGAQYVAYTKFNGGTTGYDGAGRSASDNNTLYVYTWLMF